MKLEAGGGRPAFVLVHGAWHGGWCWTRVAARLRAAGHPVFTPTCSGLGERAHYLSHDVHLETFADDITNLFLCEELEAAILVGHSFAGLVISLLADRMPERLSHLVYLDAVVVRSGDCAFAALPDEVVEARKRRALESSGGLSLPTPPALAFGISDPSDVAWLDRRLTPHPFATFLDPMVLAHPFGNGVPRTYISCTEPAYGPLDAMKASVEGAPGWSWITLATGHDAMISAPDAVAALLLDIAERKHGQA